MIQVLRESHEPPAAVANRLALAGGRNIFGEPNFRAVWGWNRLGWIGGRWTDRDPATGSVLRETIGVRLAPKYFPHNRWHIERWCAAETYGSPEQWARNTLEIEDGRNVPALGPYPSRGEYEHVFTLEYFPRTGARVCVPPASVPANVNSQNAGRDAGATHAPAPHTYGGLGEFVQLTPTIAERLARMIEYSRAAPRRQSRESLYARESQRDRAYDAWAESVLSR